MEFFRADDVFHIIRIKPEFGGEFFRGLEHLAGHEARPEFVFSVRDEYFPFSTSPSCSGFVSAI